jgi:chromosome segregation ATPase
MKEFEELFAEVQAKKVEMDVELNVDSNTLDSFMAQIKSDASELHDLSISPDVDTDEAQKRIAELKLSLIQTKQAFEKEKIAIVPDISKVQPSLNAMENRLSALQDKLKSATTIDDKDVQKVSEEIRQLYKDIQKKRVELNVDVIANDEKLENLKKRLEKTPMTIEASQSSFQKDYEGQLAAIEQQMDFNDSLIDQLKEIAEEYKNLGDAGKEGFEEVSDKIKETQEAQDALAESAKKVDKQNKKQKKNAKNWESAADAVGSFGDAMSALGSATESPELNVAGIIAQAIAELSLNGMKSLAACTTPWEYIAAAAGIIATIVATAA